MIRSGVEPWDKPAFNRARGAVDTTLLVVPPFSFPGTTARVFPLRASLNILRSFCDRYLNLAPQVCQFYPYLPYVFLVVLDYGRMAIEASNLGWVSQHEVFFSVPLGKWSRGRPGGRPVFQGWVVNTPFIFVDNASSLTGGREVYGWPKVLASLQPSVAEWLVDPRQPSRLLNLCVKGFGGNERTLEPLLDIDQHLGQNSPLVPLDFTALDPVEQLARWNRNAWGAVREMLELFTRSRLAGFGPEDAAGRTEVLFDSLRQLFGLLQDPGLDVVTLKQFRDAHDPTQACYQALVESRLGVGRFNRGGLLGLYNFMGSDFTGGYRIRLHEHPSFPIVAALGLETVQEQTVDGHTVSELEPLCPFWMSVDLTYGKGTTLCFRMLDQPWHVKRTPIGSAAKKTPFNTVAGAAQQSWRGPFLVPRARLQVYPLRADRARLNRFVQASLKADPQFRFQLWGEHVYMVASWGRMLSQARSGAWIEAYQIAFYVPVLWFEGRRLRGFAMTKPFAFIDNPTMTMTLREVEGIPAMDATIATSPQFWRRRGAVLTVGVNVFPALDAGLRSESRTLLEVVRTRQAAPRRGSRAPVAPRHLDLARRLLSGEKRLQLLTLKQFRDAEEPDRACYSSLVLNDWTLFDPKRMQRLKPGTEINVYRYPSIPMVDLLGLQHNYFLPPADQHGAVADVLQPEDPFRAELGIEIGLAQVITHTAGKLPWSRGESREVPDSSSLSDRDNEELMALGPQPLIRALLDDAARASISADTKPEKRAEREPVAGEEEGVAAPAGRRPAHGTARRRR